MVLRDSKIPVAYPWRAPRYLGRLLRRNRKNQGWPSALGPFLKQHSLAGGWSGQRRLYLTERRIILPFARYLFDSKYSSLRWNYLNLGLEFMKFIALNYRRSPWVPLCHNQYEKFDYHI